ncbi:hypothetical protein VPNG_08519 [Cytospora leucostoma]|uniref:Aflatoxin regulatory protein domain-containing protein n=1 Tax=Cytospora leucostoma TaxID=1230097 RepID=A0A423W574_9PEZI|nr:hypothetical protein VPNG_08519 [Cytospora leucostoma]
MDQMHSGSNIDHGFNTVSRGVGDGSPFRDSNRDLMDMLGPSLLLDSMTDDASSLSHSMRHLHAQNSMSSAAATLPGPSHESATTGQGHFHGFSMLGSPQLSTKRNSNFGLNSESGTAATSKAASTNSPSSSPYSTSATVSTAPPNNAGSNSVTGPHSIPSTFSGPRSGPECTCLSHLITLICRLEDLRHNTKSLVEPILHGVQLAETSWKGLMHCTNAISKEQTTQGRGQTDSNHKQALRLFATSIRILLSFVQHFSSTIDYKSDPGPTDNTTGTGTGHFISHDSHSAIGTPEEVNICVSVGGVELKGEARYEIIEVSVQRALRVITTALEYLWELTGRPSVTPPLPTFQFPTFTSGKGGSRPDLIEVPNTLQSKKTPNAGFAKGAIASSSGHNTLGLGEEKI